MSNLCQEITLPTYPINHIDDSLGEIALCILSAINVGKVVSDSELEELCDLSVRSLEELIDYQDYPPRRDVLLVLGLLDSPIILLNLVTITPLRRHGTLFMDSLSHSSITC